MFGWFADIVQFEVLWNLGLLEVGVIRLLDTQLAQRFTHARLVVLHGARRSHIQLNHLPEVVGLQGRLLLFIDHLFILCALKVIHRIAALDLSRSILKYLRQLV